MMTSNMFYVKFFAPVTPDSINALMQAIDRKLSQGAKRMGLLISTPGGDVFQGLSAYNYLKGVPLEVKERGLRMWGINPTLDTKGDNIPLWNPP
jgi:ATP-dependent protease ClpP protease subunit